MTELKCYNCKRDRNNLLMTWFYLEQRLVKKPLCKRCIDNEDVDFYGVKDMYTADEFYRIIKRIINKKVKKGKLHSKLAADILADTNRIFKPTFETDEVKLND